MLLRRVCLPALSLALLLLCAAGAAQTPAPNLPDAPKPQKPANAGNEPRPSESYRYHLGVLCGAGASTSSANTTPTAGCGAGMTIIPWPLWVELGVMGPQANRTSVSGYVTVDQDIPLAGKNTRYLPEALVGYSRLIPTGNALDYGVALALPRPGKKDPTSDSLRIELKDYWTFDRPTQHNVMLRVGWMIAESD